MTSPVAAGRCGRAGNDRVLWFGVLLVVAFGLTASACGGSSDDSSDLSQPKSKAGQAFEQQVADELGAATRRLVTDGLVPPLDLTGAARSPSFESAVRRFAEETGRNPTSVEGMPGTVGFLVPHHMAESSLVGWHAAYRSSDAFLVRFEDSFGYGDGLDAIVLVPTDDQFEAVRAVGTDAINYGIENDGVLRWLEDIYAEAPFELHEIGIDYVAGRLVEPPVDGMALARRLYKIAPDIVDQGTGDVPGLARTLEEGDLYLWWD